MLLHSSITPELNGTKILYIKTPLGSCALRKSSKKAYIKGNDTQTIKKMAFLLLTPTITAPNTNKKNDAVKKPTIKIRNAFLNFAVGFDLLVADSLAVT